MLPGDTHHASPYPAWSAKEGDSEALPAWWQPEDEQVLAGDTNGRGSGCDSSRSSHGDASAIPGPRTMWLPRNIHGSISHADAVLLSTMDRNKRSSDEWLNLLLHGADAESGAEEATDVGSGGFSNHNAEGSQESEYRGAVILPPTPEDVRQGDIITDMDELMIWEPGSPIN
ncbi:hypothetical protein VTH82DRAFT_7025 [Thermothelomyces myriococcoides]